MSCCLSLGVEAQWTFDMLEPFWPGCDHTLKKSNRENSCKYHTCIFWKGKKGNYPFTIGFVWLVTAIIEIVAPVEISKSIDKKQGQPNEKSKSKILLSNTI